MTDGMCVLSPDGGDAHAGEIPADDFLGGASVQREGVGAPLAHAHAVTVAAAGEGDPAVLQLNG